MWTFRASATFSSDEIRASLLSVCESETGEIPRRAANSPCVIPTRLQISFIFNLIIEQRYDIKREDIKHDAKNKGAN